MNRAERRHHTQRIQRRRLAEVCRYYRPDERVAGKLKWHNRAYWRRPRNKKTGGDYIVNHIRRMPWDDEEGNFAFSVRQRLKWELRRELESLA